MRRAVHSIHSIHIWGQSALETNQPASFWLENLDMLPGLRFFFWMIYDTCDSYDSMTYRYFQYEIRIDRWCSLDSWFLYCSARPWDLPGHGTCAMGKGWFQFCEC